MKLKDYLEKQQLSVQLFADICGLSRGAIHHYLNETRVPSLETAYVISLVTRHKVTYNDLLSSKFTNSIKNKYARS